MSRRVAASLLALTATLLAAAPAGAAARALDPAGLTLRLPDVGPGYSDYGPCERWPRAHQYWPRSLQQLAARFGRRGCRMRFDQAWLKHDPTRFEGIDSDAFVFDSAASPEAAMQKSRALVALAIGAEREELTAVATAIGVGDEVRVFRTDTYEGPGFAVMWRSGSVLALVHATGSPSAVTEQATLQLAAAQQAHVAAPTPLLPADMDSLEVPLDDPSLGLPVQWLGRKLPARSGQPALSLVVASRSDPSASEPRVTLQYGRQRRFGTEVNIELGLWEPRAARRLLHGGELRRFCFRRYDGGLAEAKATIFGSYEPPRPRCEHGRPEVWVALAFFRGVAVTIDASMCTVCRPGRISYDSRAGLRTLLRTLRTREPRPAPPPVVG
jgi:hypothetical protein